MTSNNYNTPSAMLLTRRNAEKEAVADGELSRMQKKTAEELVDLLDDEGLYNLVDDSGSGKTFLAWYLAAENPEWEYYAWLPVTSTVEASTVIVDNASPTRAASRRAREIRTFTPADTVLVLSETPIPEVTERVYLHQDDSS